MEGRRAGGAQQPPSWFVRACQWLRKKTRFFWGAVILSLVLNTIGVLLFTPVDTNFKKLPIGWIAQNPLIVLLSGIILLLLTGMIWLGSQLNVGSSEKNTERLYLGSMERKVLDLRRITDDLIDPGAQLDEVFIPLRFRPNRPLTDSPLTEREREEYRQRLEQGKDVEETHRLLVQAKHIAERAHQGSGLFSIAALWRQLTYERPVAVIQGFPGSGKSTLMARLALHMARWGLRNWRQPDPTWMFDGGWRVVSRWRYWLRWLPLPTMPQCLEPALIPILLRLGDYADERKKTPGLSLDTYLRQVLEHLLFPGLPALIQNRLDAGRCLVLLDGLDEVSDLQMRKQVQQEITDFISRYRVVPAAQASDYNRFLITSRVAGYDQNAFPEYLHYTIAELDPDQIEEFLPRWWHAKLHGDPRFASRTSSERAEAISKEAEQQAQALEAVINEHPAVRELAANPLRLTLLVVMQQNGIELPRLRVELYRRVTRLLLENRDRAKGLPSIPENQALAWLGPLAFQMQEKDNMVAHRNEVLAALHTAVRAEGSTPEEVAREVERLLQSLREQTGLFVQRTDDYFGFFHRTFQEYFAARYLLKQIEHDSVGGIADLVSRARRRDDLWREPFLLAVAYQSAEDSSEKGDRAASKIIQTLLATSQGATPAEQQHDLVLAATCLLEAKPLSIGPALQAEIARGLVQLYEGALRQQTAEIDWRQIEALIRRWLLSLPEEAYPLPPLLEVLRDAIINIEQTAQQRATLNLLVNIIGELHAGPGIIFATLVPPLLAVAGLPPAGAYHPAPALAASADPAVADLAVTVLDMMGRHSPAVALLAEVRQRFQENPDYLNLLACHSLETGILITPVAVPLAEESYQRYEAVVRQWLALLARRKPTWKKGGAVKQCLAIHQDLLACAEEARYPGAAYMLEMVRAEVAHPEQRWQETWQTCLKARLTAANAITYQEVALLWAFLFPEENDGETLEGLITKHYGNDGTLQHAARSLLVTVSLRQSSLSDLSSQDDLRGLHALSDLSDLNALSALREPRLLRLLRSLRIVTLLRLLRAMWDLGWGCLYAVIYLTVILDVGVFGLLHVQGISLLVLHIQAILAAQDVQGIQLLLILRILCGLLCLGYLGYLVVYILRKSWKKLDALNNSLHVKNALLELRCLRALRDLKRGQAGGNLWGIPFDVLHNALGHWGTWENLRHLLGDWVGFWYLDGLRTRLLSDKIAQQTRRRLHPPVDPAPVIDGAERIDLLLILLGRIVQIRASGEGGEAVKQEQREIAQVALMGLPSANEQIELKARLAIVNVLPVRVGNVEQVRLVLRVAETSADAKIQEACAVAIRQAKPKIPEAWAALEAGMQTAAPVVRSAIEERLQGRAER